MVHVNNRIDIINNMPPDNDESVLSESDLRMRAISSAVDRMAEQEKTFFSTKNRTTGSLSSRESLKSMTLNSRSPFRSQPSTPRSVRTPRTCSKPPSRESMVGHLLNNTIPFTDKTSAISNGLTNHRQFTLSLGHVSRESSALFGRDRKKSTLSSLTQITRPISSQMSFDYDVNEDIRLEHVKTYRKERQPIYLTEDIYTRACSWCGITSSQTYIKQVTTTREITMENTSLSHLTVKPISISLVRDHRIRLLDISGNDIGPLGVMYVSEMMAENDTIYELNLSRTNPGRIGLEALAKALAKNKSLHVLKLEGNYLDHTETEFLVKIIRDSDSVTTLHVGHNNLGYEGAKLLTKELEDNTTLRTLDLQWNHIRKESATHVCNALKCNTGLISLNLSWNGLGKEGCIALARSLPKNRDLKYLDITNNRIDVVALPFLLHGLVRNKCLESLMLAKNPMTTAGVKAVVRAITGAKGMQLKYLNIEDIPVDKEFTNLVKKLKEVRNIGVDHGVEMYGAIELKIKEHDPHDLTRFDPVMVIIEYMRIDNLRLIDLFQFFDTSNMGLVSRSDLRAGVATLGLPLTEYHLDQIMKDIDKKRDGYIDLEEFMIAQRDMAKVIIQRTTRAKGKGKEDLGLKELRIILKELVEKRNQRNKEKAAKKMNKDLGAPVTKGKAMKTASSKIEAPTSIQREETFEINTVTLPDIGDRNSLIDSNLTSNNNTLPSIKEQTIDTELHSTLNSDIAKLIPELNEISELGDTYTLPDTNGRKGSLNMNMTMNSDGVNETEMFVNYAGDYEESEDITLGDLDSISEDEELVFTPR